ncbi:SDR family oxidoreductase [Tianweitania sp. BSSL-BM11]|uniref:SDR family oxidoreductase n=1 Tax=Tianweitania aestuarii TaxID=2814886 RepID=A0ABS5RWE6_9HYPH|nr:SDR family oxidoreductase [Tianweitania aestuarii]MBS9720012.1 SDR family oxidoreductase [Tianweitania aestuarii]
MTALPVALITGGARRIGRAIALDLASHGLPVVIHCHHSHEEADGLVAEIIKNGGKAALVRVDLSDTDALDGLIAEAAGCFGPLGLLINNASIFEEDSAQDFDWETWDKHFAVHAKAPVQLARAFAQQLGSDGDGLIVNIIDQRVWRPTPRFFSYTLSKSVLWTATQTLAQAYAPRIRVNAIGPGPTLPNSRQDQADFDAQVSALILERGPDLAEFGATIRYLLEAKSVTGQMIALDGGQHLAWQTPDVAGIPE